MLWRTMLGVVGLDCAVDIELGERRGGGIWGGGEAQGMLCCLSMCRVSRSARWKGLRHPSISHWNSGIEL